MAVLLQLVAGVDGVVHAEERLLAVEANGEGPCGGLNLQENRLAAVVPALGSTVCVAAGLRRAASGGRQGDERECCGDRPHEPGVRWAVGDGAMGGREAEMAAGLVWGC